LKSARVVAWIIIIIRLPSQIKMSEAPNAAG
jgi:hypothetical protein